MEQNNKLEKLKAGFGKLQFESNGSGPNNTRNFCLFLVAVIIGIAIIGGAIILAAKYGWLTPLTLGGAGVASVIGKGVKAFRGKSP